MMEKYTRKILSNRVITSIDTDGDGQDDAITLAQLTPVNIQFFLKENVDNMGLFTDFIEEAQVIEIHNIWDFTNDGSGDGGTTSNLPDLTNPYDDDSTTNSTGGLPSYCIDPDALNYQDPDGLEGPAWPGGDIPTSGYTWAVCVGCCQYEVILNEGTGFEHDTGGVGDIDDWIGPDSGDSYKLKCFKLRNAMNCNITWNTSLTEQSFDIPQFPPVGSYVGNNYHQADFRARRHCNDLTEDGDYDNGGNHGYWSLLESDDYNLDPNDTAPPHTLVTYSPDKCCGGGDLENPYGGVVKLYWDSVNLTKPHPCYKNKNGFHGITTNSWNSLWSNIITALPNELYSSDDTVNLECGNTKWIGSTMVQPRPNVVSAGSIYHPYYCTPDDPYNYCPDHGCSNAGECGTPPTTGEPLLNTLLTNSGFKCGKQSGSIGSISGVGLIVPKITANIGRWEFCFKCKKKND